VKPTEEIGPGSVWDRDAKPLLVSDDQPAFEALLDRICDRLQDTKQQGSLKRLQKMEEILDSLERELDAILGKE
jgi:hypothetical protein